ncbi:MAG: extracellular solute-binding protein, partial [Actinomycetota bacterium]|nr:extracellular solute-binding protein [Actinomycetota bacterium]
MGRRTRTTGVAACWLLLAVSCGDDESSRDSTEDTPEGTTAVVPTDGADGSVSSVPTSDGAAGSAPSEEAQVEAAQAAALEAAGGEEIGGSVSLLGVLGGEELDDFLQVLAPFEEATGITVEYEGTRDIGAILQTRVEGGNPPDVVSTPGLGQMAELAAQGEVVDLNDLIGAEQLAANFSPSLIETASTDDQVYGVFSTVNLGGLIWYDPNAYDGPTDPESWEALIQWSREKAAADGVTPWCIG